MKPLSELDKGVYHTFDAIVIAIENKSVINDVKEYLIGKGFGIEKIIV